MKAPPAVFLAPMNPKPDYRPGLHILASFQADTTALEDMAACRECFDRLTVTRSLQKVGEAYHAFPGGGFTAIVALTESHLSIHTWPEHGIATFDVFLSNFLRENSDTVRSIYADVLEHFSGIELSKNELRR